MKSTLQAAIAAALIAAPVMSAVADVKIYGSVQAEYSSEDLDGQVSEQGIDDNALRSRIGFKATEKLGNGLTAIALLEFQANPADSTANVDDGGLSDRQQFVGLKHEKWGFVALGTFKSPYRTTGEKLDPLNETNLQGIGAGAFSASNGASDANFSDGSSTLGHTGFVSSAIYYKSPTWNNLTLDVVFSPDEKFNGIKDNEVVQTSGDNDDYALSVSYNKGPLYAFLAFGENSIGNGADESAIKIGGSFNMGAHTLSGQYEWIQEANALGLGAQNTNVNGVSDFSEITAGDDGEVWFLGYQFKMGNNTFVAQYGQTESDSNAVNANDSEYFALGMIHNFSKRTKLFAGYSETDGDNNEADREVFSVGLRKDF